MNTTVSSKGQVVLPSPIRRKLRIEAGDPLEARIEGNHIVLIPQRKWKRKPRIKISKMTGMPVIGLGPKAPKITSAWVRDMLADFP
jgi:AbrB family looped-hinge helix DNA binding protein